jgi:DNA-binding MarR family transcriptional regulator
MRYDAPAPETSAVDLSLLHATFGFNVRLLDLRLMKLLTASLAECGVTPAEATVLNVILANPGVRHGELAESLLIQPPNLTKMLKRLEAEGFIERLASAEDRRGVVLSLTPKARRLALRFRELASENENKALATFSPAERKTLIELVRRALASVEAAVGESDRSQEAGALRSRL